MATTLNDPPIRMLLGGVKIFTSPSGYNRFKTARFIEFSANGWKTTGAPVDVSDALAPQK
ncbi:hypothetical protein AB0C41_32915 [Micromonospora taraxaci]|jgi:hypothetical protein|uniref:hypothetical protein n=1 Tax=Micromonospora taraxaci TaxID=1316803 RepID=UPI0033FEAD30